MPRFRKGTTDHDNDGRMGGSMKGDDAMVKVVGATKSERKVVAAAKKAAAKPAATSPRAARKEALAADQQRIEAARPEDKAPPKLSAEAADLEHSIGRHPGGMEPPHTEESAKAALDAQFAAADGRGDPRFDEIQAGLAVRGY